MELNVKISFASIFGGFLSFIKCQSLSFGKANVHNPIRKINVSFGLMESVSSPCSPSGSAPTGKTPALNSSRSQHAARSNRHAMEALERGRLLRLSKSESSSRPIDERRDDSVGATNNVMGRTMHPPSDSNAVFPSTANRHNDRQYLTRPHHFPMVLSGHPSQWYQAPHPNRWQPQGNHTVNQSRILPWNASRATRGSAEYVHHPVSIPPTNSVYGNYPRRDFSIQANPYPLKRNIDRFSHHRSSVIVPKNITIPKELSPSSTTESSTEASLDKRTSIDVSNRSESPLTKRARGDMGESPSNMLDLLCSASLQLGAQQENPTGCSCPKSRCIALYCDCFKAGGRCDPLKCTCLNCKNTVVESGPGGARTRVSNNGMMPTCVIRYFLMYNYCTYFTLLHS